MKPTRTDSSSMNRVRKRNGAQGRNRTSDTVIFSHVLYQLSYLGAKIGRRTPAGKAGSFSQNRRPCPARKSAASTG